jgi:hypothetical protein
MIVQLTISFQHPVFSCPVSFFVAAWPNFFPVSTCTLPLSEDVAVSAGADEIHLFDFIVNLINQ